jgi:hypothetical protein
MTKSGLERKSDIRAYLAQVDDLVASTGAQRFKSA